MAHMVVVVVAGRHGGSVMLCINQDGTGTHIEVVVVAGYGLHGEGASWLVVEWLTRGRGWQAGGRVAYMVMGQAGWWYSDLHGGGASYSWLVAYIWGRG